MERSGQWREALLMVLVLVMALGMGCSATVGDGGSPEGAFALESLQGQTVTLIVPHGVGGGYDTYARLMAPYIEQHTGANVVVENVSGAGGIVGCNEIYRSEPDGFTIGFTTYQLIVMNDLVGNEAAQYSLQEFNYLGRVAGEPSLLVVGGNSGVAGVEDLQRLDVVKYGESSAGDEYYFATMVFGRDNGLNMLPVTGYEGTSDLLGAILREEFTLMHRSFSTFPDFIEAGDVVPVAINAFERSVQYPEVPTLLELADTEEKRGRATIFAAMWENTRGFIAPPGMAPEVLQVWNEVMDRVLSDPDLKEQFDRQGLPLQFLNGEDTRRMLLEVAELGKEIRPLLEELAAEAY